MVLKNKNKLSCAAQNRRARGRETRNLFCPALASFFLDAFNIESPKIICVKPFFYSSIIYSPLLYGNYRKKVLA